MATATFSGLPFEIQEMIGPFLSLHHLAQCVLVNKTWKTVFNPFLWRHIEEPLQWKSVQKRAARGELEDWNSIFLRCTRAGALRKNRDLIRSVKFDNCGDDFFRDFLSNCPDDMRQLNCAEIEGLEGDDDMISTFLRLSVYGWKRLVFRLSDSDGCLGFGFRCSDVLQEHAETLEVLRMEAMVEIFEGSSIQTLLCSAPLLKELYLIPPNRKALDETCQIEGWVIAEGFEQGEEWACMELEVFGCQIGDIPRPDIIRDIFDEGQDGFVVDGTVESSINIQRGVYKQLAQMTKLRQLTLGIHYDTYDVNYSAHDKEYFRRYDCLAMTLESGLDLLRDLKDLEVVELDDMEVYIQREEEAIWVAQHWPKARIQLTEYDTDRDYYSEEEEDEDYEDQVFDFGGIPYILDNYTSEYLSDEDGSFDEYDSEDAWTDEE
ncbi:hypothetical protein BG015_011375 [Linnemannia schmuckeri]|uniref:F-box domain-containing protein n=1 Tax=Linnemannia schmuckeri TaxID=64567 RepID=A0A9P5V8F3_9FUNG|nr:hypothetical protein BG015_011375 [Linnemannia schmuckeri]